MGAWTPSSVGREIAGAFSLVFSRKGGETKDVTMFRGVPVTLANYTSGDPFGDGTAVITFPQISVLDDLSSSEFSGWLSHYANVDIYWHSISGGSTMLDPRTNQVTALNPSGLSSTGRIKVWEGYVASIDYALDESSASLQVQCQGALYQLDRYLQKPFYPPRPWPLEKLIKDTFDHGTKPHLLTLPLKISWPTGWDKVAPAYDGQATLYTPVIKPGSKYSGYASRNTGGWDHALTGFVQDLLAVMWTDDDSGVQPGNQWAVRKKANRQPVLEVRDRFREADFAIWAGTPGINIALTADNTQVSNIVFGEGTGEDGAVWRNAVIASDGSRTGYNPLSSDPSIWPTDTKAFDPNAFASEGYINYGSGMNMDQAIIATDKKRIRDSAVGLSGTITMKVDPEGKVRWLITAGMTVKVKGLLGTGANGLNMHIAEANADVQGMTVTLSVDTRYRDLLTLEEARARNRDPLTPSKLLQVNRRSVMIEDVMAPWDYSAGSGFIPKASKRFHAHRPAKDIFPWKDWIKAHPPKENGNYYIKVRAQRDSSRERWTLGADVPILMSQKGSIRRTELVACDRNGNILPVEFHFSIYYNTVTISAMPHAHANYSPFQENAFESTDVNGAPWGDPNYFAPDPSIIIGWGNHDQPAGHSPGLASKGYPATGVLVDDSNWNFDCTNNGSFNQQTKPGQTSPASTVTVYGALYAEWDTPVYFIGRFYKQDQGT